MHLVQAHPGWPLGLLVLLPPPLLLPLLLLLLLLPPLLLLLERRGVRCALPGLLNSACGVLLPLVLPLPPLRGERPARLATQLAHTALLNCCCPFSPSTLYPSILSATNPRSYG